jgi:hypothetical protein
MRIPLVRFGGDQRPIAEWEWEWAPIVVPLVLSVLLVVLPVCIVVGYLRMLGYCVIGLFLPRRIRKEWFARPEGGFPVMKPRGPKTGERDV